MFNFSGLFIEVSNNGLRSNIPLMSINPLTPMFSFTSGCIIDAAKWAPAECPPNQIFLIAKKKMYVYYVLCYITILK